MNISYFQKINNTYKSKSRQETDLYLLNRHVDECFADTVDSHVVKRNGEPFELLIIKDTDNNTFKKKIKSRPSDKFNLGDYIEWNNQIWLVTLVDTDDKTYHSGYMYLCTVPLRWQNSEGKIIERYVYAEDFTKYSNGVTGNNTITIGDNQYGLTLPVDDETKKLKRDMRFPMDFDGGTMIVTMSFDAFNPNDDKKVTLEDGQEVWICNYNNSHTPLPPTPPEPDETTDLRCVISGNTNLKNGYRRSYTVTFTDKDSNSIDWQKVNYQWKVVSDFEVKQTITDNKITVSVNDENLIGGSFLVQIVVGEIVLSDIKINIVE